MEQGIPADRDALSRSSTSEAGRSGASPAHRETADPKQREGAGSWNEREVLRDGETDGVTCELASGTHDLVEDQGEGREVFIGDGSARRIDEGAGDDLASVHHHRKGGVTGTGVLRVDVETIDFAVTVGSELLVSQIEGERIGHEVGAVVTGLGATKLSVIGLI